PARPMWLGGVEFSEDRPGLKGHSDADVLIHAIVDALLGAAGLGDIGLHFPDTDQKWKDASSTHFLKTTSELLSARGWLIINIDATLVAERPRIMRRHDEIRQVLANAAGVTADRVGVKATTNETLGAIGRGEGAAALAVATLARARH
ncbi:MAG: 2-C-methyl-D-erythritol 2,4-cyclodiphosphate synthase, partial [Armatimonadetes bacterium]|nr:2-C-methyl-D-erythritol 2,4-cyclodiphosphate synthase [Armatimonadota bacterium]